MNAPRTRVQRRPVHGVLLLDKPLGLSSNQALQKAKWLLRADKAGHTGTLDPLATGVLPLCFGAATKFSQQHLDARKRYRALLCLGQATATGDAEGDVVQTCAVPEVTPALLARVAAAMTGPQTQVPPMSDHNRPIGQSNTRVQRERNAIQWICGEPDETDGADRWTATSPWLGITPASASNRPRPNRAVGPQG